MTWQCRRCGRTVDLVLRDGDRCAACAMRTRAGRRLPADDGAADPPVDGWDVIRMRKDTDGNNLAASEACQAAKERLRLREVGKSISITVLW